MRKHFYGALLLVLLMGCVGPLKPSSKVDQNLKDSKEVYLIVLAMDDEIIEYRISNSTTQSILYGEEVILEKKKNDKWYAMDLLKDMAFDAKAYTLDANSEVSLQINYLQYFGVLQPGDYRLVKTVGQDLTKPMYVVGNFKVD